MGCHSVRASPKTLLTDCWYRRPIPLWLKLLWPFAWIYACIMRVRRWCYRIGLFQVVQLPVPIIVVGNISVGGTGKTPVVASLAQALSQQGLRVGLVSRGYGGQVKTVAPVTAERNPHVVGDEAVLLARKTQCPMWVGADRVAAVRALLAATPCDVIVSDDGLQHLRLGRAIEVAVIDGERGLGNAYCLPMGPLREPPARLNSVDYRCVQGSETARLTWKAICAFQLQCESFLPVDDDSTESLPRGIRIHAVAGIGNPGRFFKQLVQLGFDVVEHAFPDHHRYQPTDFAWAEDAYVVMTEKDAVKCTTFARPRWFFTRVSAEFAPPLESWVSVLVHRIKAD